MGKRRKDNPFAPDIPSVMSPAEKAAAVANRGQVVLTNTNQTNTLHIYSRRGYDGYISNVDYEDLRKRLRAERERKNAELQLRKDTVDQYLLQADDTMHSVLMLHERGEDQSSWGSLFAFSRLWNEEPADDSNGDCKACTMSQKRDVPAEFRCLTVKAIYDWMKRNEAIVSHREAVSVLEVGAL